jgi:hypothetical protein
MVPSVFITNYSMTYMLPTLFQNDLQICFAAKVSVRTAMRSAESPSALSSNVDTMTDTRMCITDFTVTQIAESALTWFSCKVASSC